MPSVLRVALFTEYVNFARRTTMPTRRKLTDEERALMRELRAEGNKYVYIAHVTGRSQSVIHRAVRGYRGHW